jgi:hypothetical protein
MTSDERDVVKFTDVFVSIEMRFSLGVEEDSGRCFLAIPVSNGLVDYEEYYVIDRDALDRYRVDPMTADDFLRRCRNREVDDLLILRPGRDRGVPS